MKYLLPCLFLLASCETLKAPFVDSTGEPVIVTDQPVTVPVGDQGDTITITPGSAEPRPATIGDTLAQAGGAAVGAVTGNPVIAALTVALAGFFMRRKKAA